MINQFIENHYELSEDKIMNFKSTERPYKTIHSLKLESNDSIYNLVMTIYFTFCILLVLIVSWYIKNFLIIN